MPDRNEGAPPTPPSHEPEDELTRAALEDPAAEEAHAPLDGGPTLWRVVALLAFAVLALGIVFGRR